MIMKKNTALLCLLLPVSSLSFAGDGYSSFSELAIGVDAISYSESLSIPGYSSLNQSITVYNPTIRQVSYTGINETWGMYIQSSSTLFPTQGKESWDLSSYGTVMEDTYQTRVSDIGLKIAYHQTPNVQWLVGGRIFSNTFTRSNFEYVEPGATNSGLSLPGLTTAGDTYKSNSVIAVTEDQSGLDVIAGFRYDTQVDNYMEKVTWFIESDVSTSAYYQVQTTTDDSITLRDFFNGYGVRAQAGIRYSLTDAIGLVASVTGRYVHRDSLTKIHSATSYTTVPNIEMTYLGASLGVQWRY